jgi:hypothetical protein
VETSSILWRRLDTAGHDACRLEQRANGWRLAGTAIFVHDGEPAQLAYELACDAHWRAVEGSVRGWVGARPVSIEVAHTPAGAWQLNGAPIAGIDCACADLDLGFTPATNLAQLRRLDLPIGQGADAPAAWLDVTSGALQLLNQRYERRSEWTYWYQAPRFGYAAVLEVTPAGFVRRYPGLWEAEQVR